MYVSDKNKFLFIHVPKTAGTSVHNYLKEYYNDLSPDPLPPIHHMRAKDYLNFHKNKFSYFKFAFVRNPFSRTVSAYLDFIEKRNKNNFDKSKSFYIHKFRYKNLKFYNALTINEVTGLNVKSEDYDNYQDYCEALTLGTKENLTFLKINKNSSFTDFCKNLIESNWIKDIHFSPQTSFVKNQDGEIIVDYIGKYEELENSLNYLREKINIPLNIKHLRKNKKNYDYKDFYTSYTKQIIQEIYSNDLNEFEYEFSN